MRVSVHLTGRVYINKYILMEVDYNTNFYMVMIDPFARGPFTRHLPEALQLYYFSLSDPMTRSNEKEVLKAVP